MTTKKPVTSVVGACHGNVSLTSLDGLTTIIDRQRQQEPQAPMIMSIRTCVCPLGRYLNNSQQGRVCMCCVVVCMLFNCVACLCCLCLFVYWFIVSCFVI